MKRLPALFAGMTVVLMLLAACGPAYRGEPIYGSLDSSDPRVALGERVFYGHCHQCHPGGAGGLGFALNDKPLPGALIEFQVRNGLGAMPAFSQEQISAGELDALVTYLLALRAHTGMPAQLATTVGSSTRAR